MRDLQIQAEKISQNLKSAGIVVVESPTGQPWYFRYYDPRVLPKFIENATEAELDRFFGPVVSAFGVGTGTETATVFSYTSAAAAAPVRWAPR